VVQSWRKNTIAIVRAVVACFATVALVVILSNRTVHLPHSPDTSIQSVSGNLHIQHMDTDSERWTLPAATFIVPPPATRATRMLRADIPCVSAHLDPTLYNRAPPSC
jgi:hypothetical protein